MYIMMFFMGVALLLLCVMAKLKQNDAEPNLDPFEFATNQYGDLNIAVLCPHCQKTGKVRTKTVHQKKGISGGKLMGGLMTGGVSLFATGLSRKELLTQAHCGNCSNTWHF